MTRRGLALLMVLAVLIIASSASVSILRVGIADQLGKAQHREAAIAGELLAASEPAVLDWLERKAERAVLPPDVTQPGILVLRDEIDLGGEHAVIEISAWDQAGMATVELIRMRGEFTDTLPDSIRSTRGEIQEELGGLDQVPRIPGGRVFPMLADESPSLGALIATHNPIMQINRQEFPFPLINVNTAPLDLIETALDEASIDAIEPIRIARAEGRRANLSGISVGELAGYRLVGTSSVWAVRTDARVGHTRRSWWTVYANRNGEWERMQRLVIDE